MAAYSPPISHGPAPHAGREFAPLIDLFSLALSHGLMFVAAWRLLRRPDLDVEPKGGPPDA